MVCIDKCYIHNKFTLELDAAAETMYNIRKVISISTDTAMINNEPRCYHNSGQIPNQPLTVEMIIEFLINSWGQAALINHRKVNSPKNCTG